MGRARYSQELLVSKLTWALLVSIPVAFGACRKQAAPTSSDDSGAVPQASELPPLDIKDNSPNLLLTWIDDKGDFHVVQKPSEVPKEGRDPVRVVVTTREEGTGKLVYTANLNEVTPSGSYRVKTMTRAAWDELGASKRKTRLEALSPSATPPASAPEGGPSPNGVADDSRPPKRVTGVTAIIYGASWCKPCHDSERFLKQRGVTVIHKDIEENEVAAAEMRQKLARAGRAGSSIPVIDVMGQILVGFSPSALDQAIAAARSAKPL